MRDRYKSQPTGFAFTVVEFCELHKISRTSFYKELQLGRLEAVKMGSKTLILPDAAARWAANLPRVIARKKNLQSRHFE